MHATHLHARTHAQAAHGLLDLVLLGGAAGHGRSAQAPPAPPAAASSQGQGPRAGRVPRLLRAHAPVAPPAAGAAAAGGAAPMEQPQPQQAPARHYFPVMGAATQCDVDLAGLAYACV